MTESDENTPNIPATAEEIQEYLAKLRAMGRPAAVVIDAFGDWRQEFRRREGYPPKDPKKDG